MSSYYQTFRSNKFSSNDIRIKSRTKRFSHSRQQRQINMGLGLATVGGGTRGAFAVGRRVGGGARGTFAVGFR